MSPWLVAAVAAGGLLVSLVLGLAAILLLPAGHFAEEGGRPPSLGRRILRNAAGVLLLAAGVVLSLPGVPGPGLVLAFVGLTLVDIPGKRRLQRRLVRKPRVRRTLNGLRSRFHRTRFRFTPR